MTNNQKQVGVATILKVNRKRRLIKTRIQIEAYITFCNKYHIDSNNSKSLSVYIQLLDLIEAEGEKNALPSN